MSRPKPPTSTSTPPPKPPLTAHPSSLLSGGVAITGIHPVTIGANTVIHLRSKLTSAHGTITIGDGCIIGERAVVGLQGVGETGVVIGNGVVVEAGARVEGSVGEGTVIEAGGVVGRGAVVGKVGRLLILLFLESTACITLYNFLCLPPGVREILVASHSSSLLFLHVSHDDPTMLPGCVRSNFLHILHSLHVSQPIRRSALVLTVYRMASTARFARTTALPKTRACPTTRLSTARTNDGRRRPA